MQNFRANSIQKSVKIESLLIPIDLFDAFTRVIKLYKFSDIKEDRYSNEGD